MAQLQAKSRNGYVALAALASPAQVEPLLQLAPPASRHRLEAPYEPLADLEKQPLDSSHLVQCATLFCTYRVVATSAAFARVTLARMSVARAVHMNGLGSML